MRATTHSSSVAARRAAQAIAATAAATLAVISGSAAAHSATDRAPATPNRLVHPAHIHLAGGETLAQAAPEIRAAEELYTWWNTGDVQYLDRADAPSFHDNTLPAGRPQGRNGIVTASKQFRAAVPDLRCAVPNLWVTGDTFTAQLVFSGHFTGTLDGHHGTGQRIHFRAIDVQYVGPGGRITEDWHLEDNLTFLEQTGVVTAP